MQGSGAGDGDPVGDGRRQAAGGADGSASDPAGSLPRLFGLKTMPTSYLIDRKGVVRYVHRGFKSGDEDKLREEIRRVLEARP